MPTQAPSGRIEHMFDSRKAPVRGHPLLTATARLSRTRARARTRGSAATHRHSRWRRRLGGRADRPDQGDGGAQGRARRSRLASPARCPWSGSGPRSACGVPRSPSGVAESSDAEVALARHVSPTQGARHLGFAAAMTEMPHTMRALSRGQISEWSATVLVKETAILSREHRAVVDAELGRGWASSARGSWAAGPQDRLPARPRIGAASGPWRPRRSTRLPASSAGHDAWLTDCSPWPSGVRVQVALDRRADAAKAQGDERSAARSWPTP